MLTHPSYPDLGELAFGKCGRRIVGVTLYAELFSALVLFIILIGTNLVIVLPNTFTDIEFMVFATLVGVRSHWCFWSSS